MLDGLQAGLSWLTILRKREAFREAFEGFDPRMVARFRERDMERLLKNAGIVRSRAKIEATIGGARAYLAMQEATKTFDLCLEDGGWAADPQRASGALEAPAGGPRQATRRNREEAAARSAALVISSRCGGSSGGRFLPCHRPIATV